MCYITLSRFFVKYVIVSSSETIKNVEVWVQVMSLLILDIYMVNEA